VLHILRTSNCADHPALTEFDQQLRISLSDLLNVSLDDEQWIQASLPVKEGGLGIRSVHQVASSAFLASVHGATILISSILPQRHLSTVDPTIDISLNAWCSLSALSPPTGPAMSVQRNWDMGIISKSRSLLLSAARDDYTHARLLAVSSPHAGDWLNASPITAVGLKMTNEVIRVATGLRLGAVLCTPHTCPCGAPVDARGSHGLLCSRSAGRQQRHSLINDIIFRALIRANISTTKEPSGLLPGSLLRPDGATIIPWVRGKCLAWDATTPDTLAASHLPATRNSAGAAAEHAAALKERKYSALSSTHHFVPVTVETLGPWNPEGLQFIRELGRRIGLVTEDPRETAFLLQKISVAVQMGNAASFVGSLPSNHEDDV